MSAAVVVRYGAKDTRFVTDGHVPHTYPEGVAHYLEHQLFTRADGTTVDEVFSSLGADVNAWTNHEKTAYTVSTAQHPTRVLHALLDFVTHPTFTEASVQKEQGIIAQEIRMVADDPWEALHRRSMSTMYPHHSVTHGICGSERSIARITPEVLYDCYRAFYRPELMCLIVCGDVSDTQVMAVVDEVFGERMPEPFTLKRGKDGSYRARMPVLHRSVGRANISKPMFQIAWRDDTTFADPTERLSHVLAMDVISEILFSRAGVLYNRLLERDLITPAYSYGYTAMSKLAYHAISGESDHPDEVLRIYHQTLDEFRKEGISSDDFERNRRVAYAGFVSEFDDTDDIVDLLVDTQGSGCDAFARMHAIDSLTLENTQQLFCRVLDRDKTSLAVLDPNEYEEKEGEVTT
jgi:predicted Zn-dependent peptidase